MTDSRERPPKTLLVVGWYSAMWRAWLLLAPLVALGGSQLTFRFGLYFAINAVGLVGAVALVRGRRWGYVACVLAVLYDLYRGWGLIHHYLPVPHADVTYLTAGIFFITFGFAVPYVLLFWPTSWRWFRVTPSGLAAARA